MKKIIIILFLTISTVVSATTYYVSTSGNNANNGLTTSTPWQTLQYAELHAVNPGDIIALKRGDVWLTNIALGIHHGGTSGIPITWDGALWGTGANAIIRSSSNRTGSNLSVVNIIGCSNVKFQNITVDGNNTYTFGIVIGGTDNMYSTGGKQNGEKNIIVQNSAVLNIGNGSTYALGLLCQTWNNDISDITIKGNTFNGADDEQLAFYGGKTADGGTPAQAKNIYIGYNTMTNWGRRGKTTGYGLQINNKITDVIIEKNYLTTGPNGRGNAIHVESNESAAGAFPERITIRYNKIYATVDNTYCIYITQGQAKTVDVYYNLLYSSTKTTSGGGVWVVNSVTPSWTGAKLNFYNNTIYTLGGRSFTNDCAVSGVVTLKNNILINSGTDDYGMMCLVNNSAGASTHSNNLYYRNAGVNFTKVKDGGSYKQTPAQVLAWETTAKLNDPLFKVPGTDLRLQTGSPAIDAGIAITGMTKDIDGTLITNPPDLGCYQTAGTLPAPVYLRSALNPASPGIIEVTYDISLANVVPAMTSFNVKINSVDRPVASVAIAGSVVKLSLSSPGLPGEIATFSYTKPTVNMLQSTSGSFAASISAQLVTNNLVTVVPPISEIPSNPSIRMIIYPNPVHHVLNIKYESTGTSTQTSTTISTIRITDMTGRLVLEQSLKSGITYQQIPINLRSGVYVVTIVSNGLAVTSRRIVVYN